MYLVFSQVVYSDERLLGATVKATEWMNIYTLVLTTGITTDQELRVLIAILHLKQTLES